MWPRRRAQTVALDKRWWQQQPKKGKGLGHSLAMQACCLHLQQETFPERAHAPCTLGPHPIALCPPPCSPWQEGLEWLPTKAVLELHGLGDKGLVTAASRTSLVWGCAAHVGKGDEWKGTLVTPTFRQGTCQKVVHADRESDFCGLDALQARGCPGFLLFSMLGSRRARPPC